MDSLGLWLLMGHLHKIAIGIDDTDSTNGMCTTFIVFQLVRRLIQIGARFNDYPRLIRLNPNIPWKTRGNGALSLIVSINNIQDAFKEACRIIEEYSEIESSADPGLIISSFDVIPKDIEELCQRTISEVVSKKDVEHLIRKYNLLYKGWGKMRGLIGALASIGYSFSDDATYELIAFRSPENWGSKRLVDGSSIIRMSHATYPYTFNNYDDEKGRIIITPRGPDPVLLGIRGEDPELLLNAYRTLKINEKVFGYMIFKTNQGTSVHLKPELNLENLGTYRSGHFKGVVFENPTVGIGGHVYFKVMNEGLTVCCAAYEPTGNSRKIVLGLLIGDRIEIGGSVRRSSSKHPRIVNLEYLKVIELVKDSILKNPICVSCNKKMTSRGKNQGFRCNHCGLEDTIIKKLVFERPRIISKGLYVPPPRAQRHLTKPLQRYFININKDTKIIDNWFENYEVSKDFQN